MYRLIFHSGRLKGRRFAVQQGTLLIGRDPACQIDLADDDSVSRHHAQLESRRDGVWLKDLGALNPALVNGEPITEVKLRAGDRIEVGHTKMEFQPVEAMVATSRRKRSRLQILTVIAVAGILVFQLIFILLFPLWQRIAYVPPAESEEAVTPAAATGAVAVATMSETTTLVSVNSEPIKVVNEPAAEPEPVPPELHAEVQELKEAVSGLRDQVQALVPAPAENGAATATVSTATQRRDPLVAPVPERPAEADPLDARTRELLVLAQGEARKGNWLAADQALERLLILSPDYLPGLVERARVYEKRSLLKESGETWARIMNITAGTPLYNEAAAERQRLAREELRLATLRKPAESSAAAGRLPRRIRIMSVDRERFQGNKEFDEMRIIRVNMRPRMGEGRIDVDDVRVWVVFFDRVLGAQEVVPSGATVPEEPLRVETAWGAGEQKNVTATYILPKSFRADEEVLTGQKRVYEGYRVQLWYKGELQDEDALPSALMKLPMPEPPESSLIPSRPSVNQPVRRR